MKNMEEEDEEERGWEGRVMEKDKQMGKEVRQKEGYEGWKGKENNRGDEEYGKGG